MDSNKTKKTHVILKVEIICRVSKCKTFFFFTHKSTLLGALFNFILTYHQAEQKDGERPAKKYKHNEDKKPV